MKQFGSFYTVIDWIVEIRCLQFVIFQQIMVWTFRKKEWRKIECVDVFGGKGFWNKWFQIFKIMMDDIVSAKISCIRTEGKKITD